MQPNSMNNAAVFVDLLSDAVRDAQPQTQADREIAESHCYCPTQLLSAFTLLMAGHGRCVNASMMLGDHHYAMRQLARAHTINDGELRFVAAKLFAYFDAIQ